MLSRALCKKHFDRRIDPLPLRSFLLAIVATASLIMIGGALSGLPRSAAEVPWVVPDWLQTLVGEGEGQIALVVLQRARALYLKKVSEGAVNNPCYFAMDATRPGVEGWVQVQFTITATGTVKDPVVVDAMPKSIFDDAALKAIARWRYNPKVENGTAVERVGVQTRIVFQLEQ